MPLYCILLSWCWRLPVIWRLTRILPRPDYRGLLLNRLPKHARIAEIGVWKGDFSARLLQICEPRELHLVEPWHHGPDEAMDGILNWKQENLEDMHMNVVARFSNNENVFIDRVKSKEYFNQTNKEYFDFVYIDGDHSEESAYEDLCISWRSVKTGGMIAGDDYFWADMYGNLSIKAAVDRFCRERLLRKCLIGDQFLIQKV